MRLHALHPEPWLGRTPTHCTSSVGGSIVALINHISPPEVPLLADVGFAPAALATAQSMPDLGCDSHTPCVCAGKRLSVYYADDPAEAHCSCGLRFWRRSNGCCHFARRFEASSLCMMICLTTGPLLV